MPAETDFDEIFNQLEEDIAIEAATSGDLKERAFFRIYHDLAVDNGDFSDLEHAPAIHRSATRGARDGYRVDGVSVDPERRELVLAISDYRQEGEVETMDAAGLQSQFRLAERFFERAIQAEFINELEEMSLDFEAANPIFSHQTNLTRVKIVVLSNARLSTRKKTVEAKEVDGRTFTYSVLDLARYADILASTGGTEPLDIDILELNGGEPVPCLQAYSGSNQYQSYLVALPASFLAEIYGRYGARLLEQNVRAFLQARTKVNRGIIDTVAKEPEMFFAYNNGITVTASGIKTAAIGGGGIGIAEISNMQIVNGGQTTASILYSKDLRKADLSSVYVQMKLTVIEEDQVEEIVPKISRWANTQNRVSESDFFAGHPFHVEMERKSRRISAPPRAGAFHGSKWFYERARGQYADKRAYGSQSQKKKFEAEFPKDQLITKTDAAKYQVAFSCRPDVVSQGAQKCFMAFANEASDGWEISQESFNDDYFRDLIARAIIFRWCDKMIGRSEWYQNERGYKAQTTAYSISWIAEWIKLSSRGIDFSKVWKDQEAPDGIQATLELIAPKVAQAIRDTPSGVTNISEYAKKGMCWDKVKKIELTVPQSINEALISLEETNQRLKDAEQEGAIDSDIQLETLALLCSSKAEEIREFAKKNGFLSPAGDKVLTKISRNKLMSSPDQKPWSDLVANLREYHFELPKAEN